ncbi:MAG: RAD52 family DNA repair protein [Colwellia sp.]|nr:RAD52 family DNA repair protein [Colwellia sp.]
MSEFMVEDSKIILAGPLDLKHVKTREKGKTTLSYVEGWHVIAEANRIFGYDSWTRETVSMIETSRDLVLIKGYNGKPDYEQWRVSYVSMVRVVVCGVTREGTGFGSGMGKPNAIGDAIEGAVKEAETDAMKRAFMTFGNPFGLALYDKTQANVIDPNAPPKRLSAAQAKRDGLNNKIKELLNGAVDLESVSDIWAMIEDDYMPILPLSWADSMKDLYEDKREELKDKQS